MQPGTDSDDQFSVDRDEDAFAEAEEARLGAEIDRQQGFRGF